MKPGEHIEAGRDSIGWYRDARYACQILAASHNVAVATVCDVLAITSPRVAVRRNAALTRHYLATGKSAPGTLPGVRASLRHWESTGEIRGPKTRAFSDAIQGDESAVVLDVWVARAFGAEGVIRAKDRRRIIHAMRSLAGRARLSPRDAQEALWVSVRRQYGRTSDARLTGYL